jgi:hypothetical protein
VRLWLRLDSPVLGVIRDDHRVEIPAWFVTNEHSGRHRVDDALRLPLAVGEQAVATGIRLPPGRWSPSAHFAQDAQVQALFSFSDGAHALATDADGALILEQERSIELRLRVTSAARDDLLLDALELERRAPADQSLPLGQSSSGS